MEIQEIHLRPVTEEDREWVKELLKKQWGSEKIISRGKAHDGSELPGFIAMANDERVGLITYSLENDECEIVTLNSLLEGHGIGTRLIDAVVNTAKEKKCKRVWLTETNDNTDALHFYQRRGFHLIAVYPNAVEESRKLKSEIPLDGKWGIPIRDELELEIKL